MVRHHMKKKKKVDATNRSGNVAAAASSSSSVGTSGKKNRRGLEEELVDLDRFAGSSDEDEDEGEDEGGADEDADADAGGGGDGDDNVEKDDDDDDGDDDGEGSDSEGDSEDDYDDAYADKRKIVAKTSEKKRRGKEDVLRRRRADVDGVDGKGRDEGEGGEDDDDDYDDDYGATTTSDGRGARQSKSIGMADAMSRILGMAAGGRSSSTSRPPSSVDDANKRGKTTASKSTANHINNNRPVILSKTTTPLQRLQQKVRMEERALVQKRRNRRAENLVAMRLPLAPTAEMSAERLWKQKKATRGKTAGKRRREGDVDGDDAAGKDDDDEEDAINAMAIAGEIESERAHRRIATRGVVALFNAISKHRSAVAAEAAEKEEDRRRIREEGRLRGLAARNAKRNNEGGGGGADNDAANAKTKHGFLDMIKMSAAAGGTTAGVGGERERGGAGVGDVRDASSSTGGRGGKTAGGKSIGWSALKDDFMMNSKLKDWDKEISDDDDDDDDVSTSGNDNGNGRTSRAGNNASEIKRGGKRQRA